MQNNIFQLLHASQPTSVMHHCKVYASQPTLLMHHCNYTPLNMLLAVLYFITCEFVITVYNVSWSITFCLTQKKFWDQNFWSPKTFSNADTKHFLGLRIILDPDFFCPKHFFRPKHFFDSEFFWLNQKIFLIQNNFRTQSLLNQRILTWRQVISKSLSSLQIMPVFQKMLKQTQSLRK